LSGEVFALCSIVTQEGELPVTWSMGWVELGLWVGWCRVWHWVRVAGLQRVLLIGILLYNICSIRDRLGSGKEVAEVAGGMGKGSSVVDEGFVGGVGGWWVGWCGDGMACWVIIIVSGSDANGRSGWVWGGEHQSQHALVLMKHSGEWAKG